MYAVLLIWKIKICIVITAEQQSVDKRKKSQWESPLLFSIYCFCRANFGGPNHNKMYSLAAVLVVFGFEQGYGIGSLFFLSLQSIFDLETLRLVLC